MANRANVKLQEALKHTELAEKCLKTSLFKWSVDHDGASSEYTKAATCFKLAGSLVKAKESYILAANSQEKSGALFHSAKLLTQAATIATEQSEFDEAVELTERACSLYREHGSPDTAAATLVKAGKICENRSPEKASVLYMRAAELCQNDEKMREAADHMNQAVRMELKQKRYMKAQDIMAQRRQILLTCGNIHSCHQITLAMIITCLAAEKFSLADQILTEGYNIPDFAPSNEARYGEEFIRAYKEGDEGRLKSTRTQPTVTHMDTEIAKVARALTMSDAIKARGQASVASTKDELEEFEEADPISLDLAAQVDASCKIESEHSAINSPTINTEPVTEGGEEEDDDDDFN